MSRARKRKRPAPARTGAKKGPRGPAKRTAKKLPERRAMIAAARGASAGSAAREAAGVAAARPGRQSRPRAGPSVAGRSRRARIGGLRARACRRLARLAWPRLRPLLAAVLPRPRRGERAAARGAARRGRGRRPRPARVVTPRRALGAVIARRRRLPRRLPVHRLPRRSRSASPATPACRRWRQPADRRRPRPPARPTPTCWSRSAALAARRSACSAAMRERAAPRAPGRRPWGWSRSP